MYTIGTRVLRQWEGAWYSGTITQVSGDQAFVQFDDGDSAWLMFHELQLDSGAQGGMYQAGMQQGGMYQSGSRIRRLWTDGNYYHGTVQQVSGAELFVQFDDGESAWLNSSEVEPETPMGGGFGKGMAPQGGFGKGAPPQGGFGKGAPPQAGFGKGAAPQGGFGKGAPPQAGFGKGAPPQAGFGKGMAPQAGFGKGAPAPAMGGAMFSPGQRVNAQWSDGGWYGATITQVGGPDSFFVTYDDGFTAWLQAHQLQPQGGVMAGGMMAGAMKGGMGAGGMMGGFTTGMRVQKQWVDGNWYGGTILQIGSDGTYFVQFDDGDSAWVAGYEIQPL